MIRGIVFDMDGLMFDTERLAVEGWIFAGVQMGFDITKDIVIRTLGMNIENTEHVFRDALGDCFDFNAARKIKFKYITDHIEKNGIPVKNGLIELLEYLKLNQYKFTVATSSDKEKTQQYFEKADISKYFNEIVTGDMIENGKPSPDIYIKAIQILGVDPDQCIALEDSSLGILSAYRAGIKPVMIPDLMQPDEDTNKLLFRKLPTLFDVIELLSKYD